MYNQNKTTITKILFNQAIESVENALEANKKNEVDKEVQYSINASLLLGIVLEGFINEIGEIKLDKFTWEELEKSSTPLKWRIISGLIKGFQPGEEPLQTIVTLQKIRNKIVHPKSFNIGNDVILSNKEFLKINPNIDFELPNVDLNIYIGYEKLIKENNCKVSYKNLENVYKSMLKIVQLLKIEKSFGWLNEIQVSIKKLIQ